MILGTHCDFIVLPSLGDQAISTMTWYPTQSYYPEPNSPVPIRIMPNTWLRSDKYQSWSHWFDSTRVMWTVRSESPDLIKWETETLNSFGHPVWSTWSVWTSTIPVTWSVWPWPMISRNLSVPLDGGNVWILQSRTSFYPPPPPHTHTHTHIHTHTYTYTHTYTDCNIWAKHVGKTEIKRELNKQVIYLGN